MAVSITKSISVHPKVVPADHHPKILTLSNLDRQCPTLMYMVFFYNQFDDSCFDSVFSRLQASLEATLSTWYPAAGRLIFGDHEDRDDDDDGGDRKLLLNILCNNAGAVLVQAVTQAKISDLGDLSVYNDFFETLVFKPTADGNVTEMPLVVAQVTKFECGGYSIGIGSSHSVFDGISAFEFFRAWASESRLERGRCDDQPVVVHERGALLLLQDHHNSTTHTSSNIPTAIHHLYQLISQQQQQEAISTLPPHDNDNDQEKNSSLVFKTFHLSAAMIQSLKDKVDFDRDHQKTDNVSCSSFQLLAAHLWKVRTKALRLERERTVCLQFAVDIRKKMVPPLPKGFSGNGYVLASLVSTAGELEEQSHRYIIERINETKNSINDDYVKAYVKALDHQGAARHADQEQASATLPQLPELTVVSDWTRIPFHKVDFFGEEAAYASPLIPPVPHVAYFMQNPIDSGAVDVRIGLLPTILADFSRHFVDI